MVREKVRVKVGGQGKLPLDDPHFGSIYPTKIIQNQPEAAPHPQSLSPQLTAPLDASNTVFPAPVSPYRSQIPQPRPDYPTCRCPRCHPPRLRTPAREHRFSPWRTLDELLDAA